MSTGFSDNFNALTEPPEYWWIRSHLNVAVVLDTQVKLIKKYLQVSLSGKLWITYLPHCLWRFLDTTMGVTSFLPEVFFYIFLHHVLDWNTRLCHIQWLLFCFVFSLNGNRHAAILSSCAGDKLLYFCRHKFSCVVPGKKNIDDWIHRNMERVLQRLCIGFYTCFWGFFQWLLEAIIDLQDEIGKLKRRKVENARIYSRLTHSLTHLIHFKGNLFVKIVVRFSRFLLPPSPSFSYI